MKYQSKEKHFANKVHSKNSDIQENKICEDLESADQNMNRIPLPSRQLSRITTQLSQNGTEDLDILNKLLTSDQGDLKSNQVDLLVQEITLNKDIMADDAEGEQLRSDALRNIPHRLVIKRKVKSKLSASVSIHTKNKPPSLCKRIFYGLNLCWRMLSASFKNLFLFMEFWYKDIRKIEGNHGSAVASYFYFLRRLFVLNLVITMLVLGFIMIPQIIHDLINSDDNSNATAYFYDFFSGSGRFAGTIMFYGHYHSGEVSVSNRYSYFMPYAYFFTMVLLYMACFVSLSYKMARSYRRNFIESTSNHKSFSTKLFCGFDFSITSGEAARLNSCFIYTEFKELLHEKQKEGDMKTRTQKISRAIKLAIINVFVIAVMASTAALILLLLRRRVEEENDNWPLIVATTVTAVVTIYPYLFSFIARLEKYKPRTRLYITLTRLYIMDLLILSLLLVFWYERDGGDCWETSLGQEAYCLVVIDLLVSLFILPLIELARGCLYRRYKCLGEPEFNIATGTMSLIYTQSVLWLGLWFSPVICIGATMKLLLTFYMRSRDVRRHNGQVWRAVQTQTLMFAYVTMSLLAAVVFFSFIIFRNSSASCGPFKEYDYIYSVLTNDILRLHENRVFVTILKFIFRPGFIAFLLIAMGVVVYVVRARGLAHRSMADILTTMLELESKDKRFLLETIAKVSKGEWRYSTNDAESEESTHTWKYLHDAKLRKPANAGYRPSRSNLQYDMHLQYVAEAQTPSKKIV